MSSRALRRLERQRQQSAEPSPESESDEYEPAKPAFNAFALLGHNEDESDASESEESSREIEAATKKQTPPAPKPKRKGKGKGKKQVVSEDSDEELDRILAELKQSESKSASPAEQSYQDIYDFEDEYNELTGTVYDSNFKYFTTSRLRQSLALLNVGLVKNLDPDQELRNLFGDLSLELVEDANNTSALAITPEVLAQFKKIARLTRGWSGKDRRSVPGTTKKLLLTRIKDDYLPTAQKPLNMEELRKEEVLRYLDYKEEDIEMPDLEVKVAKEHDLGVRYFRFAKVPSVQDRMANTRFYAAVVMTPDPDSLMQLLQQNPYHEETLLQVAMVLLRQGGDKSVSNALVERALFVFDRSFHKKVHELLSEGKNGLIRLPFEGFVNRQFYLCLFRYIINLGERSMFLTALAYCKLLLSLSPAEDPLGVRYFIDHYAMCSEEYKYLINLSLSPLVTTYEKWNTPGIAFSTAYAHLKLGEKEKATKALEAAVQKHPYTAAQLLEAIGGTPPPVNANKETALAAETYLLRAAGIWKEASDREFLRTSLSALIVPESKSLKDSLFGMFSSPAQENIPHNLIRFAILSGENKIMAKVPEQIFSRDDVFEYDVLPPRDTTSAYNEHTGVSEGGITDTLLSYVDQNVLGAILQNQTRADADVFEAPPDDA